MMVSRAKIDRTVEAKDREESALYRGDGTKLYSDEEHDAREADVRQRFRTAMDAIDEEAESLITAAEESLLMAENSDPTDALTTEELASANARRPFVSDEVWTLPLEKLTARCRAVLAQGDKSAMFLYALYAGQRVQTAESENGAYELVEMVSELRRKANPDGEKRIEAARKALQEAGGVKDYAYLRRRGAKDALELYQRQAYGATR